MFRQHIAASRARERRAATASAGMDSADVASTAAGGSFTRRRMTGAATPAATRAQAPALMALESRKARQYKNLRTAPEKWPLGRDFLAGPDSPFADRPRS